MATFDEWLDAYDLVYTEVPARPSTPCPNCGHVELALVFTAKIDDRIGYAHLWCNHCLEGIVVSRSAIPVGAIVQDGQRPPEERVPTIPNYRLAR